MGVGEQRDTLYLYFDLYSAFLWQNRRAVTNPSEPRVSCSPKGAVTVIIVWQIAVAGAAAYSKLPDVEVKSYPTEEHVVLQAAELQTQLCTSKALPH